MKFSIGVQKSHVAVKKDSKRWYQAQPGRQKWASVVKCICMNGELIQPFIIFKGEKVTSS